VRSREAAASAVPEGAEAVRAAAGAPTLLRKYGDDLAAAPRDVVEHGGPRGDTSAMEDVAGLQAAQQAVDTAASALSG
jgi:hypothetical protein